MFKKYGKLAFVFFVPVALVILYAMIQSQGSWQFAGMMTDTRYGNIPFPQVSSFRDLFTGAVLMTVAAAAAMSLFVFTELRSRGAGGFIASLPVKKSAVYTAMTAAGFLLITLSFLLMGMFYLHYIGPALAKAYDVFEAHGQAAMGLTLVKNTQHNSRSSFIGLYCMCLCLFSTLTCVQTMFQKPIGAVVALAGAPVGVVVFILVIQQFLTVLAPKESAQQFRLWISGFSDFLSFESSPILAFVFTAISVAAFFLGLLLFKREGRNADFIFTFPAVKTIMHVGVTVSVGSLAMEVFCASMSAHGLNGVNLTMAFLSGAVLAWLLTKKIFTHFC